MIFVLQMSLFLSDEVLLMLSKMYISQFRIIPSIALSLLTAPVLESVVLMKTGLQNGAFIHVLLIKNPDLASACTLDPDLVGYIWNGADAAYPANYVLHRSTKTCKDYMKSPLFWRSVCQENTTLSKCQNVFGQWINGRVCWYVT
jgi:hypothetical protein